MIDGKKILAIIPARGGSKGIKDKNIRIINGKPMIYYTIQAAIDSGVCDNIIVSTDSDRIRDVSLKYGAEVPFMRPVEYASDTSKTIDAVLYTIEKLESMKREYDILILLQATSPLRDCIDIKDAFGIFMNNGMKNVASISKSRDHPVLLRSMTEQYELIKYEGSNSTIRRQDMSIVYRVNGAIYINKISELNADTSFNDNELGFLMEPSHSIDIDDEIDLFLSEILLKQRMEV